MVFPAARELPSQQTPQVVNKVEESKEKCYEISHYLVSILHIEKFLMDISSHVSQVEVI